MNLGEHDQIVAAYAQRASGPGWGNQPIWVIVRSRWDGSYRLECLQPENFSPEIWALYDVSEVAHKAMTDAVRAHAEKLRKRKRAKEAAA